MPRVRIPLNDFLSLASLALVSILCCACGSMQVAPDDKATAVGDIGGHVFGGQQAISGATIQLYAVGTASDGSAATALLTSAVTTNANGAFNLTGLYTCPTATTEVYLLASGGNPGMTAGTNNATIALIAALGQCGTLGPGTFISLNEVTTVAAMAALYPYFAAPAMIGSGSVDAAALQNGFVTALEFAATSTGASPGVLPGGYSAPTQEINTLANIVATCVNSVGGVSGDGSPCGYLFKYATPSGGIAPTDIATALADILNNPTANVSSLYNLPTPSAPFQPALASVPTSWGVALSGAFTVTYLSNGAVSGVVPTDSNVYPIAGTVTVLGNTGALTNTALTFAGWNTAADGSGTTYVWGSTFSISSNVTLYAQYKNWPISVWGGAQEAIALKADGTVWTWGNNQYGELGNNTTTNSNVPVQVQGPNGIGYLTAVTAIMGGETHNVALKADGTVWAWGWNALNQLGDGTTTERNTPVQVNGLTNIVSLGSRAYHTLAIRSDGTVWAWGYDKNGALGNGKNDSSSDNPVPIQVPGITNAKMVSAGYCFSLVLLADGTMMSWGQNNGGQLGDGTTTSRYSPVVVQGISNVVWISAGWGQSMAITSDGRVWTWGSNYWGGNSSGYGLLGNGGTANSSTPTALTGLTGPALTVSGGDSLSAFLLQDGTMWTFGSNGDGQLGIGNSSVAQSLVPLQVTTLPKIVTMTARDQHADAIDVYGRVWAWGDGLLGELGNGTNSDVNAPVMVNPF